MYSRSVLYLTIITLVSFGNLSSQEFEPEITANTARWSGGIADAFELGEGEEQDVAFGEILVLIDEAIAEGTEDENPLAFLQKGQAHMFRREYVEADLAFDRAEELYPDYFTEAGMGPVSTGEARNGAWTMAFQEGAEFLAQQDFSSAAEYFQLANELYSRRPEAFMNLAVAMQSTGDIDGSIQAWYDAVGVMENPEFTPEDPEDVAQWNSYLPMSRGNLGSLLSSIPERSEEAIDILQEVVEEDPSNSNAQGTLAMLLAQSGEGADAMAIFDIILADEEGSWQDYYNAGITLYQAEDWGRSALAFQKLLVRAPMYRDAMDYRVWSLFQSEQYAEQIEVSAALLEIDPNNETILRFHYQALSQEGRGEEAQPTLDKLLGLQFAMDALTLAPAQEGGSVSGYLINKAVDPGTDIKLLFTYYDASGAAIGTTDIEIEAPDLEGETTFSASFEADVPVLGYSYEVVE
jgi:tetratricopeptide (TPR) repeat protein